jgi:hypothetical protein
MAFRSLSMMSFSRTTTKHDELVLLVFRGAAEAEEGEVTMVTKALWWFIGSDGETVVVAVMVVVVVVVVAVVMDTFWCW